MTPARTRHRAVDSPPRTTTADRNASGPRVWDDMTVEVALSLMACARVDHLVLCDGDDRNTGLVTLARLAVLRDSPAYTDRIRLRDVLAVPCALPAGAPRPAGPSSFAP